MNIKKYKYTKSFTVDGQRYKVYADTKEALMIKYVHKKEEIENGLRSISRSMTVADWAEEWLKTYKEDIVSVSTMTNYRSRLRVYILPHIGHMQLKNVKQIHVQKIYNSLRSGGKGTMQVTVAVLKQMFQAAVDNGLMIFNPVTGLRPPKIEYRKRRSLTDTERQVLLSLCDDSPLGVSLRLSLYCGLRPGETLALLWRNVDLERRIISVDSSVKIDETIGPPKSKAGYRKVPLPDAFDLKRPKGVSPFSYVLTGTTKHWTRGQFDFAWKKMVNRMNIALGCTEKDGKAIPPFRVSDDLVPYILRHTYCTDLQDAGVPINVAKELMGHSSIDMTARIYTHSSETSFENARVMINSLKNDTLSDTLIEEC